MVKNFGRKMRSNVVVKKETKINTMKGLLIKQHVPLTQALRRSASGVQGFGSSSISRFEKSGHIYHSHFWI